jgi:hypothetical protein
MKILWHTLVVGPKTSYHLEAQMLLISLLANRSPGDRVRIGTDRCDLYRWLEPAGLEVEEVSKTRIQHWIDGRPAGTPADFFRARLAHGAELACTELDYACAWVDVDAVATGASSSLNARLEAGICLMHRAEDFYRDGNSKAERAYWKALSCRPFAGIQAQADSRQWNAGVVAVPAGEGEKLKLALAVMDDMARSGVTGYALEQVAVSLTLEQTGPLEACDRQILHYWANRKQWLDFAQQFLLKTLSSGGTAESALRLWRELQADSFPAERQPRPSRAERFKRKVRKHLGLLAPSEKLRE